MLNEHTSIEELYGVGPKVAERLNILGLYTVNDLLHYYPRRYEDFSNPRTIDQIVPGESQIIQGRVVDIENEVSHKKRMKLTRVLVADKTGQIGLVFFNQPFLIRLLKDGTTWLFSGKVERDYQGNLTMQSPEIEREGKILAVYGETVGITSKMIRKLIAELKHLILNFEDHIPDGVRTSEHLISLSDALSLIHSPISIDQVSVAKRRLAFDELFILLTNIQLAKKDLGKNRAPHCKANIEEVKTFIASLPFTLTDTQRKACWDIIKDIEKYVPMNRLVEGDVGSGKTVVGALASFVMAKNGYRSVWMAPTEILANQHYKTCQAFLEPFGVKVSLLTGSTSSTMGAKVNEYDLIIGTQALIQEKVTFEKLGLIIVDEQHRFGVKQRNKLIGENQQLTPHFLAMTATPIPRTLALTIYGDLDISALQTVPGRQPVTTKFVDPSHRRQAYDFIRKQIQTGRQAFVVCPLVEAKDSPYEATGQLSILLDEKKAATAEYEKLSKYIFPDLRVALLHGKMKSKDKEEIMRQFRAHEVDVLVSTAVIEVGIDIANASVMMIEGADRFGLAQLHQFRGRVGRGGHQSYCFVFTDTQNPVVFERLRAFADTHNGFDIAELDLELRGPGQLLGLEQSGLSGLKIARLSDIDMILRAKKMAAQVIEDGLEKYPLLRAKVTDDEPRQHLA